MVQELLLKLFHRALYCKINTWCIQEAYPDKDRDVETIRASLKAISLRLLINLTYVPSASPHLFLALLPFAYTTCLRASRSGKLASIWEGVKQCSEEYLLKENDRYLLEFCRSKQEYDGDRVLVNLVSPGLFLGPLLLFRLVFKLSQAGYGVKHLQRMTAPPDEMPLLEGFPTYLVHIHQVADSKVMGKLIRMSIGIRAVQERNRGKELIRDGRLQSIITAVFSSAAELTLTIIAFASHPINISTSVIGDNQKAIRQAKREAALCLGNAAEMAGRTGQWGMARSFSKPSLRDCFIG